MRWGQSQVVIDNEGEREREREYLRHKSELSIKQREKLSLVLQRGKREKLGTRGNFPTLTAFSLAL